MTVDSALLRVSVRLLGMVRGREINAVAVAELHADALIIAEPGAKLRRVAWDAIDGLAYSATQLSLYLADGDVLELSGDESVRTLALQLTDHACTMPELTRGLRALGSRRGTPGAAHDAWFAPLLAVRRAVNGVSDARRQLALVDAGALSANMLRAMTELAALTAPGDKSRQRAIEAAMEEESHGMFEALNRLGLTGEALRGTAADTLLLDWRRWAGALQEVFVAADEAWERCSKSL
jgi:hypothetical protein